MSTKRSQMPRQIAFFILAAQIFSKTLGDSQNKNIKSSTPLDNSLIRLQTAIKSLKNSQKRIDDQRTLGLSTTKYVPDENYEKYSSENSEHIMPQIFGGAGRLATKHSHDKTRQENGQELFIDEYDMNTHSRDDRLVLTTVFIQELFRAATTIAWIFVVREVLNSVSQTLCRVLQRIASSMDSPPSHNQSTNNDSALLKINGTLNSYEMDILNAVTLPSRVTSDMKSIGGLTDVKIAICDIVYKPKFDVEVEPTNSLLQPTNSILLFGPPGCGKSSLANAMCKYMNVPMLHITPSLLLRKWVGDTSQLTKAIFTVAEKIQPCIVFVDEMDSLFRSRVQDDHPVDRNIKTEFMQLWDTMVDRGSRVLMLGATNRPQDLDSAILRRFERDFLLPMPDATARAEILRLTLQSSEMTSKVNFQRLAAVTDGYSPSDLKAVCKAAVSIPLREYKRACVRFEVDQGARALMNRSQTSVLSQNNSDAAAQPSNADTGTPARAMAGNASNATPLSLPSKPLLRPQMRAVTQADFEEALRCVVPTSRTASSYGERTSGHTPGVAGGTSESTDPKWYYWSVNPTDRGEDADNDDDDDDDAD